MNLEFMLSEVTKSQKKNSYALPQIQNLSNNMYNKSTYEYLITKKKTRKAKYYKMRRDWMQVIDRSYEGGIKLVVFLVLNPP